MDHIGGAVEHGGRSGLREGRAVQQGRDGVGGQGEGALPAGQHQGRGEPFQQQGQPGLRVLGGERGVHRAEAQAGEQGDDAVDAARQHGGDRLPGGHPRGAQALDQLADPAVEVAVAQPL